MSTLTASEWATRKKHIDPQLAASGWMVETFDGHLSLAGRAHHALTEFPTGNGRISDPLLHEGKEAGFIDPEIG